MLSSELSDFCATKISDEDMERLEIQALNHYNKLESSVATKRMTSAAYQAQKLVLMTGLTIDEIMKVEPYLELVTRKFLEVGSPRERLVYWYSESQETKDIINSFAEYLVHRKNGAIAVATCRFGGV